MPTGHGGKGRRKVSRAVSRAARLRGIRALCPLGSAQTRVKLLTSIPSDPTAENIALGRKVRYAASRQPIIGIDRRSHSHDCCDQHLST